MKKKKGIILLVTLFFIITITTLYLKNLSDSKKLIDSAQDKYYQNYTLKIIEDLNNIVSKLNKDYELYTKDGMGDFFESLPSTNIPLEYKNIFISTTFEKLEFKCNINDIYNDTSLKTTCIDVFNNNQINLENFTQYTKNFYINLDNNISNSKQKNYIIDMFIDNNLDEVSENIKDDITFFKDSNSSNYLKTNYDIFIDQKEISSIETIYELKKSEVKVKDIEISYK